MSTKSNGSSPKIVSASSSRTPGFPHIPAHSTNVKYSWIGLRDLHLGIDNLHDITDTEEYEREAEEQQIKADVALEAISNESHELANTKAKIGHMISELKPQIESLRRKIEEKQTQRSGRRGVGRKP